MRDTLLYHVIRQFLCENFYIFGILHHDGLQRISNAYVFETNNHGL